MPPKKTAATPTKTTKKTKGAGIKMSKQGSVRPSTATPSRLAARVPSITRQPKPPIIPGPAVPLSADDKKWVDLFTEVWGVSSVDTTVVITIKPIPSIEEVYDLTDKQKKMLTEARQVEDNSLSILVDEEAANVFIHLNYKDTDHYNDNKIFFEAFDEAADVEPFRRAETDYLEYIAIVFVSMMKEFIIPQHLLDIAKDIKQGHNIGTLDKLPKDILTKIADMVLGENNYFKIIIEATPSYRSARNFGETILRNVYAKFLVENKVPEDRIEIYIYEWNEESDDPEKIKRRIPFPAPVTASRRVGGLKKTNVKKNSK